MNSVTDKGDGTLATEITYSPENDTITNKYDAEGEVELEAIKAISGADAAVAGFTADGKGGIVNSSRAIMTAWKARGMDPKDFGKAARLEALDMKENLNGALKNRKYV